MRESQRQQYKEAISYTSLVLGKLIVHGSTGMYTLGVRLENPHLLKGNAQSKLPVGFSLVLSAISHLTNVTGFLDSRSFFPPGASPS